MSLEVKKSRKIEMLRQMTQYMIAIRRHVTSELNQCLAQVGSTQSEMGMMSLLVEQGPMNQNEIAARLLADRAQISRLVNQLRERGFLQVEVDENDRRARIVSATAEGAAYFLGLLPATLELVTEQFQNISEETVAQVNALLAEMAECLGVSLDG